MLYMANMCAEMGTNHLLRLYREPRLSHPRPQRWRRPAGGALREARRERREATVALLRSVDSLRLVQYHMNKF